MAATGENAEDQTGLERYSPECNKIQPLEKAAGF
jgi:hypothetical protein